MKIENKILGEIEVEDNDIIYFPKGIIGYEEHKEFVIINDQNCTPFCWLISVNGNGVSLPVVNPHQLHNIYKKKIPSILFKEIDSKDSQKDVFCIVNIKKPNNCATVNLKGPIMIDHVKHEGEQVILTSDELSVSFPLN